MGEFKFLIKKNSAGYYYFVFVSSNGQDICWSEAYTTEENAIYAANLVKNNAGNAPIYRNY